MIKYLVISILEAGLFKILLFSFQFLMISGLAWGQPTPTLLGHGYEFANNGKVRGVELPEMYVKKRPEIGSLEITRSFQEGVKSNLQVLARIPAGKIFKVGNLKISGKQLKKSGEIIEEFGRTGQIEQLDRLDYYQINGEDGRGNVHFTGYFTPRLEAREKADDIFKYPIYSMPKGRPLPSRKAIDHQNALAGQGLELAYTSSLLDNFFLSVQGSGILDFGNGRERIIGYAGSNGHSYRSVGKMLIKNGSISTEKISLRTIREWFRAHPHLLVPTLNNNPSYCFFKWRSDAITGATGVSLAQMHSVAVDKSCIPYGACLIAEVPILDRSGSLVGHQWRILFAHDTGGAIRGPGHLDLYHGQGQIAGDNAGDLHHYGRVWLMLPAR